MLTDEETKALLERVAILEQKTQGIRFIPQEEQDEAKRRRNGDGGDISLQPGKADRDFNPEAKDGRFVVRGPSGDLLAIFDFEARSFRAATSEELQEDVERRRKKPAIDIVATVITGGTNTDKN